MKKLGIVIVSYNVRFFLEECLCSVEQALSDIDAEVWVVDNASVDNSVRMVREQFSWVKLIANENNVGFSKANNQAIRQINAEYILLLNPDTVIPADSLQKLVGFMDRTPDAGALGVKMIDGDGKYLPESKRGLPSPFVAFCKMSGLTTLFPKSSLFARYYLGHLDKERIHQVDVLSGAFMLLRSSVLQKTGLLDETFFMYGEDVDLSYRVSLAGFKNYYYPHTTIIHYKGKSTSKMSYTYTRHFYNAMLIFTRKHKHSVLLLLLLQIAITCRAAMAVIVRLARKTFWPLLDWCLFFVSYCVTAKLWAWYKFGLQTFRSEYFSLLAPSYALLMVIALLLMSNYNQKTQLANFLRGVLLGFLFIIAFYAFSPEWLRFSRVTLLVATGAAVTIALLGRFFLKLRYNRVVLNKARGIALVGKCSNQIAMREQIIRWAPNDQFVGFIHPSETNVAGYIGSLQQITDLVRIYHINTLLFYTSQLNHTEIIASVMRCGDKPIKFLIIPSVHSVSDIDISSEVLKWLYPEKYNSDFLSRNKSNKRKFDICAALLLLLLYPVVLFFSSSKIFSLSSLIAVLRGKKTFVGYSGTPFNLPSMKSSLLKLPADESVLLQYSQNYSIRRDGVLLFNRLIGKSNI